MDIKILVTCCSTYGLPEMVQEVVDELGITATIEKVSDLQKIMAYGILKAPAIVINEKVKVMGRVPGKKEIMKFIQSEQK